ncbi:MAG: ABC transporter ATP-binding protein [Candidatus Caldatribacteriaceae bacterium]
MSAYLVVEKLSFGYDGEKVLRNVSFTLEKGTFMGIVGPNGSGKSTLLHLLAGILLPQEGRIRLGGKDSKRYSRVEWARRVAIVFQEVPSRLHLPCLEVVTMGRFPHLKKWHRESEEDEKAVAWAMEVTQTSLFAERDFSELSGGEKQRVMIARALAQKPELLLLDEPTSHLDVLHQLEVMKILHDLQKEGITALGVFHEVNAVAQFCQQALFLKGGSVLAFGPVEQVMTGEWLTELLDVEFLESTHPLSLRPFFVPLTVRKTESRGPRVHLICGGGRGIPFIRRLLEGGFSLSVGVVNRLDSDEEFATRFQLPVVREAPFSPFGQEALEKARELAREARFIVIIPTYWGQGNLPNLELALDLAREGKSVVLLKESLDPKFDYTGGEALRKLEELRQHGARVIEGIDDLFSMARE